MHSLYIIISVLFFVTPSIYGQTVSYATFASGQTTYDKFQLFLSQLTTVDSSNQRVVHSSGGAAGGIVSEGQGYGVFLGAATAIALGSSDSRYSTTLNIAYQLFKGWKAMCKGSTTSGNCQSSFLCPDTTVSPVAYYPCLPHWKFTDQLGQDQTGSATDGDIDGITGTCLLAAQVSSAKPTWYTEVAEWCYGSIKQFYDNGVEEDTVGGVAEAVVKLGSCWGGISCTNPSYHAPGHYRILRNWLQTYAASLGKSATEISSYTAKYDKLVKSSWKIIISNQNTAGLTTNWYIPNSSDLSKSGSCNGGCDGSGTPFDQYGAEAARGVYRAAVDFVLYQSSDSNTYLSKVVKQLTTKFTGSSFNNLDTGGFVNSVFASWQSNAFIYGPTFCALVDNLAISNQAAALSKARDIVSAGSVNDYYGGSWTVLSTLLLSGDLAKCASLVAGTPQAPQAPVTPVAPPKAPTTPPTAPVTPITPPKAPTTPPTAPVTPITPPKAPTTPPTAPVTPVTPPKVPTAPTAPSAHTCTLKGCAINLNYVEFATSTIGVTTAGIMCADGRTVTTCTVAVSGASGRYACSITGNSCLKPVPVLDGVKCPLTIPNSGKTCASGSGTNSWWVEFVPPTSTYNANIGSVLCADGRFQSCADGSGKLNCAIKENSCTNPAPIYDGSFCLFPGSSTIPSYSIISDSSTQTSFGSLPVWGIALIVAGCVVVVIVLVITVAVIRRKRSAEEIV